MNPPSATGIAAALPGYAPIRTGTRVVTLRRDGARPSNPQADWTWTGHHWTPIEEER